MAVSNAVQGSRGLIISLKKRHIYPRRCGVALYTEWSTRETPFPLLSSAHHSGVANRLTKIKDKKAEKIKDGKREKVAVYHRRDIQLFTLISPLLPSSPLTFDLLLTYAHLNTV